MFKIIQGGKAQDENRSYTTTDWQGKLNQLRRIDWRRRQRHFSSAGPRTSRATIVGLLVFLAFFALLRGLEDFGTLQRCLIFGMRWTGLLSVAFGLFAYVLVQARNSPPRTWSAMLDADLAAYEPVDLEAYRLLQERTRFKGYFEYAAIAEWLYDERSAVKTAAGWHKPRNSAFLSKKV